MRDFDAKPQKYLPYPHLSRLLDPEHLGAPEQAGAGEHPEARGDGEHDEEEVAGVLNRKPATFSLGETDSFPQEIKSPRCDESAVIRGVVAGEPVVGAVVPAVPPVVEVELGALVLQRVHAGIDVDEELKEMSCFECQRNNNMRIFIIPWFCCR